MSFGIKASNLLRSAVMSTRTTNSFRYYQQSSPTYSLYRSFHTSPISQEILKVPVPPLAESISDGDVSDILKNVGDTVEADEIVLVLETDKIDVEVTSPKAGVITQVFTESGATVSVGSDLFEIDTDGAAEGGAPAPKPTAAETPTEAPAAAPAAAPAPAPAPAAATPKAATPIPKATPAPVTAAASGDYGESRVKMTRMRLKIAERLKESQEVNAMLTTFNEVDMSNIMAIRNKYKDAFLEKHGVKLGFMSAFLAASTKALKDQPVVNAVIEGSDIVYRDAIDISVGVSTPKGLVVPVLREVNNYNYVDFEKSLVATAKKARDGNLAMEDMVGGTFTISNGGVFGSLMGTPIINMPQSAILGMHGTFERPVAINGKVEIRPMMYIALTYDHRLVDGREAVTFLKKIKECVEDPVRLSLDL